MKEGLPIKVKGHVKITDDLGNVLVDRKNAIHMENMARVIARALSNENNYFIERMAFGNGGTNIDAAQTITFNSPNNGVSDGLGWRSTLYNETYSEVVNENINVGGVETENPDFGSGPGADPGNDPSFTASNVDGPGVVSRPVGTLSEVRVQVTLNAGEPSGQLETETGTTETESAYMFDEIGLFTSGRPHDATSGYQDVDVGSKTSLSDTGLLVGTDYEFLIGIDGAPPLSIVFNTGAGTGGVITYQDLIDKLLPFFPPNSIVIEMGNNSTNPPYYTHSKFRFRSLAVGSTSQIELVDGPGGAVLPLFANITDFNAIETAVQGEDAGVANDALTPSNEGERMLTHVIFNPVLKNSGRTLTINYTLTVSLV